MNETLKERLGNMMAKDFVNSKKQHIIELKNLVFEATSWCPEEYKMATRLFIIRNNLTEVPKCVCGAFAKVNKTFEQNGFRQYCGDACSKKYRKSSKVKELGDRDWLYEKRIVEKFSYIDIGKLIGVSDVCVANTCLKLGIPEVKHNWTESATEEDKKSRNTARTKTILGESVYNLLYHTSIISDMYYNDMMSLNAISEELNVSIKAIKNAANSIGLVLEKRSYHIHKSKGELLLFDFIKSIIPTAISGYRPNGYHSKETDIFIPELNIGIDYHGCYVHSDACKTSKNYHKEKLQYFNGIGIRYIQIWSDDWLTNRNVVKSFLGNILDKSNQRIGARKTKIITCSQAEYAEFLDNNHMQGSTKSSIRLACLYDDKIVSVMGFSKIANNTSFDGYYLDRFANTSVIGAFSKLLKTFTNQYHGDIYSFADLQTVCSINNVYTKNGFVEVKRIQPDYKYFHNTKTRVRTHKFNFRKSKFESMGIDISNKTESQLAEDYGLVKCYDSGKILYKLSET